MKKTKLKETTVSRTTERVTATHHGCMGDKSWQGLINDSVLGDIVGRTRGTRRVIRVVDTGLGTHNLWQLNTAVTIAPRAWGIEGLTLFSDPYDSKPVTPLAYWISAPQGYDFETFLHCAYRGEVPTTIRWESWDRERFDGFVDKAKDLRDAMREVEETLHSLNTGKIPVLSGEIGPNIGLDTEFILTMVASEAMK